MGEFVAVTAADVLVRAREREFGALVVIEGRGSPLRAGVAITAGRDVSLSELAAVRVGVALLAFERSIGEICVDRLGPHVGRLVTIDAGHSPVRAYQSELGPGMIEARKVFPDFGRMTCFATGGFPVCAENLHAVGKLAAVRILVAGGAGRILKVINRRGSGRTYAFGRWSLHCGRGRDQGRCDEGRRRLVAIVA